MGFFERYKKKVDKYKNKAEEKLDKYANRPNPNERQIPPYMEDIDGSLKKKEDNFNKKDKYADDFGLDDFDDFDDYNNSTGLMPAQKPESFHYFILENQYVDLERKIRGVKDVYNKETKEWEIKRKKEHCFTDEESEEIVRTAQAYLSTDIKLGLISRTEYPIIMRSIGTQLINMFRSIMEYRFGRFGSITKQYEMKLQAKDILQILLLRIKSNYSRALEGHENKATHNSVKGQESLQQTERRRYNNSF